MTMSEPAVLTRGLTKIFGGQPAVDGLDLEVPRGSVFALLGPNGAGKTTTIKLLLNLLQPTAGEIRVLGLDAAKDSAAVRRRVGYQAETQRFYPRVRVEELFCLCRSLYPRWNTERVTRYCRIFELPPHARVGELSKGKLTLLALVLAVGPEPELLLLDEPATGLDPLRRRQVLQLLVEEMAGGDRTIIISSHQLQDVERIADRVGFLLRGKLILSRPLEQLLGEEKKVRVLFPGSPPADLPGWPGVRRVAREGSHLLISLSGHLDEVLGRLNRYEGVAFEVLDQTLEDIFVEYVAGEEVNREAGEND
ncbi:MAG TPA: ABC transporter ATP-binding protein [Desulfotomaculum sp.]|nr:ABC transporter ATP-binding protein [Desulfotomaculum sp.]